MREPDAVTQAQPLEAPALPSTPILKKHPGLQVRYSGAWVMMGELSFHLPGTNHEFHSLELIHSDIKLL